MTARDRIQILHFTDRKISSTYWADGEIDLEIQQMFANTNTAISGTHFQKFRLNSAAELTLHLHFSNGHFKSDICLQEILLRNSPRKTDNKCKTGNKLENGYSSGKRHETSCGETRRWSLGRGNGN